MYGIFCADCDVWHFSLAECDAEERKAAARRLDTFFARIDAWLNRRTA